MQPFNPQANFMQTYSPLGISRQGVGYVFQTVLPPGLVPDLNYPLNAKAMQSGTPFTSEINMQGGVIYASKKTFDPFETTIPTSGYRLGLDAKDSNIAKFLIGDSTQFFFWDGRNLLVQGNNVSFDANGTITAGNPNGQHVTMSGYTNDVRFYDSNNVLVGVMSAAFTDDLRIDATQDILALNAISSVAVFAGGFLTPNLSFFNAVINPTNITEITATQFVGQLQLPIYTVDPDVSNDLGSIYYNSAVDEVRVLKSGGWVTII